MSMTRSAPVRRLPYEVVSNPVLLRQFLENPEVPGTMQVGGGIGMGESVLRTAVLDLDAAAIKALRASPAVLVNAPGPGKVIVPVSATLVLKAGTNVLTANAADDLRFGYNDGATQVGETIETTGFLNQAADTLSNWHGKKDSIFAVADAVNKNLALKNTGAAEFGGNAAGDAELRVVLLYQIVSCGLPSCE